MSKRSVVFFAILLAGAIIIYYFSPGWGIVAFILWNMVFFVHLTNLSVGQPAPATLMERANQTFPVRIEVNGMFLSVLLEVTAVGTNAKGTLACFNTEEYWKSVMQPIMAGCVTKNSFHIEQAIREVANEKANQFNRRMKELGSASHLTVDVVEVIPLTRRMLDFIASRLAQKESEEPSA